jgi:hypothetical protein
VNARSRAAQVGCAPQSTVVKLIVLGGKMHNVRALVDEHARKNIAE